MKTNQANNKSKSGKFKFGLILLVAGLAMYGIAAITGFLPIDLKLKGILIAAILIIAEVVNVVAIVLLGKEVVKRYKSKLNPKNWFKKKKAVESTGTQVNIEKTEEDKYNEDKVVDLNKEAKGSRIYGTTKHLSNRKYSPGNN
ncbi:transporter suffix domain-containing protein [Staphylococcus simulans]|uniref:transporter suffix domain-containing protein n=1 Tax=Staphylococcus simulans TaxID=1286 RepID=UPI001E36B768|nr:transporter suffix domain-containing protein [Staphylococcus simulans]MCD8915392.1 transporter suffix domain-containing protein [Staphylococcus simulans]